MAALQVHLSGEALCKDSDWVFNLPHTLSHPCCLHLCDKQVTAQATSLEFTKLICMLQVCPLQIR